MKLTKADLEKKVEELEAKLKRAEEALLLVDKEFQQYKQLKAGMIGVGSVRNPKAGN